MKSRITNVRPKIEALFNREDKNTSCYLSIAGFNYRFRNIWVIKPSGLATRCVGVRCIPEWLPQTSGEALHSSQIWFNMFMSDLPLSCLRYTYIIKNSRDVDVYLSWLILSSSLTFLGLLFPWPFHILAHYRMSYTDNWGRTHLTQTFYSLKEVRGWCKPK